LIYDAFFLYFQDQSQAILDSSQFLNEINHFKIRLDTLEKERYDLEDKVRRLQVCFLFVVFTSEINLKAFLFFIFVKEENEAYKNRLANGNNDWIGSRSTSALNGRATPASSAGKRCLMM